MKLWLTRTSRESCMLTTEKPTIKAVNGSDRQKAFVSYGDPIGTKNLCIGGMRKLIPGLKLEILESKQIEILAQEVSNG